MRSLGGGIMIVREWRPNQKLRRKIEKYYDSIDSLLEKIVHNLANKPQPLITNFS